MKRVKKGGRVANPDGGYGSYGVPGKAESAVPKRGTGKSKGGHGEYGANTKNGKVPSESFKGVFGIGKSRGD
jgi:hypothetical protein